MEQKFTWTINKFTKLGATRLYSAIFSVGCSKWQVLICPKGDGGGKNKYLSIFLKVADSTSLPMGWSMSCKFSVSVVDQIDARYTITLNLDHKFKAGESISGFPYFMPLSELHDLSRGYVLNDTCIIKAEVDVQTVAGEDCCDTKKETTDSDNKEVTDETKDHTSSSIDVDWANDTVEGMMSAALKNLRDHHLSVQGFTVMMQVLEKGFISLGASQQLFEDTWRPWIDDILQSLKELDDMEEALKMDSTEAALRESLLKINKICQLQEVSCSKLETEEHEHGVDVGIEIANAANLTAELSVKELAERVPRPQKRRAALLSAKCTLDGLRAQKAKMEGQLEDLQALVADGTKTLKEKKVEIWFRIQVHPTRQACNC